MEAAAIPTALLRKCRGLSWAPQLLSAVDMRLRKKGSMLTLQSLQALLLHYLTVLIGVGCASTDRNSSSRRVVQPDYKQWERIKPGMTEVEVEKILGRPLERDDPNDGTVYFAQYGIIECDPARFPTPYTFSVEYYSKDRCVCEKHDPFDGRFSPDGRPTVPILINPVDGQEFDHYPRNLDFRWSPSSGVYPVTYEIQFNWTPDEGWAEAGVYTRKADA